MSDDRPNRYVEDGRVVYRASSIGGCVKAQVAAGLGVTAEPFPSWLLERFRQGVEGEGVVLDMLRKRWHILDETNGWWLNWHDGQVLVEVEVGTRVVVRGHADAVGTPYIASDGVRRLIEIKCVTPGFAESIQKTLPPLYLWQISTYARALRLPAVLVLGIKDEHGDVERIVEQPVETVGPVAIKLRVMDIERHIQAGVLPPCTYRQWPCPFPELCDQDGPDPTLDWELEDRLRESLATNKNDL